MQVMPVVLVLVVSVLDLAARGEAVVRQCDHDALWNRAISCGIDTCINDRTTDAAKTHKVTPSLWPSWTMGKCPCILVLRPTNWCRAGKLVGMQTNQLREACVPASRRSNGWRSCSAVAAAAR